MNYWLASKHFKKFSLGFRIAGKGLGYRFRR
jgi:hypothetical protein